MDLSFIKMLFEIIKGKMLCNIYNISSVLSFVCPKKIKAQNLYKVI